MHGEVCVDAQRAADAVDHDVDALDFWAVRQPGGACLLRELAGRAD